MTEQPIPYATANSYAVLPYVRERLTDMGARYLAPDLNRRAETGLERYGTYLMTHNGRNALQDALEELLDALMYLEQHNQETGQHNPLAFRQVEEVAIGIKHMLIEAQGAR